MRETPTWPSRKMRARETRISHFRGKKQDFDFQFFAFNIFSLRKAYAALSQIIVFRSDAQHRVSIHGHQDSKQNGQSRNHWSRKTCSSLQISSTRSKTHYPDSAASNQHIRTIILASTIWAQNQSSHFGCSMQCAVMEKSYHTLGHELESQAPNPSRKQFPSRTNQQPASTTESSTTNHAPVPANHPETTCWPSASADTWRKGKEAKAQILQLNSSCRMDDLRVAHDKDSWWGRCCRQQNRCSMCGVAETSLFLFFSSSSFSSAEREKKEVPPVTTRLQMDVMNDKRKCKHQKQAPSLNKKKLEIFFRTEDSIKKNTKVLDVFCF